VSILYHTLGNRFVQPLSFLDLRNFSTFIWMILAVLLSRNPTLSLWACQLPFDVNAATTTTRFERWLHNKKIDTGRLCEAVICAAIRNWNPSRIVLALDTSMLRDRFCAVRVSMICLGRALSLAWKVLEHGSSSVKFKDYRDVLKQARARLPEGTEVVFLADRGFVSKKLMKQLNEWGWDWRIRIKGNQVLHCRGRRMTPKMLGLQKGNAMMFSEVIDFGGNLHGLSLSAGWSRGGDEPWYILSNAPARSEVFMEYGLRFDIEEEFRDEKSGGFNLEKSCLQNTEALERMILIMTAAALVALNEGWAVTAEGKRREVDTHWCRGLSYFQIGWRWILKQLSRAKMELKCCIELTVRNDPLPVGPTRKEAIKRRKRKDPKWHFRTVIQYNSLP
jgi:hypothetical protein